MSFRLLFAQILLRIILILLKRKRKYVLKQIENCTREMIVGIIRMRSGLEYVFQINKPE
jgi:hypothetical protein